MIDTKQKTCDDAINRQWLMECVNEGWIKFDTEKDKNRFIHLVRDMAPPVTPQSKPEEQCINRQEAIDAFQIFREYESNRSSGEWVDRIETVLNHLQPVTPRSDSEDIAKAFQLGLAIGFGERYDEMDRVIDEIKKVITPQPNIGYWREVDKNEYACSNCNRTFSIVPEDNSIEEYKYCPNCITKMIKIKEKIDET